MEGKLISVKKEGLLEIQLFQKACLPCFGEVSPRFPISIGTATEAVLA